VSNAGLKVREPVIGDELDQATYGRPTTPKDHAPRERRPAATARTPRKPKTVSASQVPHAAATSYDSGRTRFNEDGVRTVKIRGQATPARRRAQNIYERPMARYDQHPDRAAQWALFLGVFMVVVAIVTGT
jgi:hypothetical protein